MEQSPAPFNKREWLHRTKLANDRKERMLQLAHNVLSDPMKIDRLDNALCVVCYYTGPVVAGQAMTTRPCASCGVPQLYASTNTDALCLHCAQLHSLCKHCNATVSLNPNRLNWPKERE